jgi:hypothetical protein
MRKRIITSYHKIEGPQSLIDVKKDHHLTNSKANNTRNIIVLEGLTSGQKCQKSLGDQENLHLKEGFLGQEDCSPNHHLNINIMELEGLTSGQSSQKSQTHLRDMTLHKSFGDQENLHFKEGPDNLDDQRLEHHLNKKLIRDKIQKPSKEFKRTIQLVQLPKKVEKTTGMG